MKKIFGLIVVLSLSLSLLVSCGGSARELLSYQKEAHDLLVSYEAGGIPIQAHLVLGEGERERSMRLTILSPEEAAGVTFVREGARLYAEHEGTEVPMQDLTRATTPLSFFSIPATASVTSVEKGTNGSRTAVLADGDVTWTLVFPRGGHVPCELSRTEGNTYRHISLAAFAP